MEPDIKLDNTARKVIGAAIEVHRHLGPGFFESVYKDALAFELASHGIPFQRQAVVSVSYKGNVVGSGRVDLLVSDELVVELKAVDSLLPVHHAQLLSYLKALGATLGLLINFNVRLLREGIKRIVLTH